MKQTILIFLITFLFSSYTYAFEGTVILITDGDTITVVHNGKPEKIRLYGIDTPESKQAFGTGAKNFTYAMVYRKSVNVEPVTTDRYGRTVGIVKVAGKSLSEELVKSGFAWVYDRYCKKDMCDKWKQLEKEARQSKSGLWSQDEPVEPWMYRKRNRK
jgi:endonuclease YncB( thermonuclease family)